MQRWKFGSFLAAAALATSAAIPLLATPAGAANQCSAGQFPASFAAQSSLKVDCHTDAGTSANHIEVHDADNVIWHHAAARNATLTGPGSTNATTASGVTLHFANGAIQTRDVRRPINAFVSNVSVFKGGTFITGVAPAGCTSACTSATISQAASSTHKTITARIEMTTNRVLADVTCAAGSSTLTSNSAKFVAGDAGKSVSGGPFAAGTFITTVTATVATMNQPHTDACSTAPPRPMITIGAAKFVSGSPVVFNGDPMALNLSNASVGGQGFSCASGSHTLTMSAASKAATGGFVTTSPGIPVTVRGSTTVATTATAVSTAGNSSLTLAAACPAGIAAATGSAQIGAAGADTPVNGSPMMSLTAILNLNPALVTTQDSCANNTFEGFEVIGGWQAPGSYTANTSTPPATVAQVNFPTSVIAFNGFVVPKATGDTLDANPHFNFSFPLLPTTLAVCLNTGTPANPVQLAFGFAATTKSAAPFLATGSGNPQDPGTRQLLPETGTFSQTIELLNANTQVSQDSSSCTIPAATAAPALTCGDG